MVSQVAQHPGEGHFRVSRLEAARERGLDALLGLGGAHTHAEEIGIATEVLDRRQRDGIDPVLDRDMAGGRKPGDPMGERADEIAERAGGQRSVDPAVAFSQLRVVILRAQQDFERPRAAQEARQVLDTAHARDQAERLLRLTENR